MRPKDFQVRLQDHPFRPFRVHLSDGDTIVVRQPAMVILGRSTAVLPGRFLRDDDGVLIAEDWRTVSLLHVAQFSDLGERVNGKRKRRK